MRAARIDANQKEIVAALRSVGVTVQHLHMVGDGCPDILCAIGQKNVLIELKDGSKPPSKQTLTPDQVRWHAEWRAPVHVVNSVDAAMAVVAHYKALKGNP